MAAPSDPDSGLPFLRGQWRRLSADACADRYPAELTFASATYRGTRGTAQGMIWWDAGTYRLADDQQLILSTATDELVAYPVQFTEDLFTFTDPEGCQVTYERMTPRPSSPSGPAPEEGDRHVR